MQIPASIVLGLLAASLLPPSPHREEPSLAEREALCEEYSRVPMLVAGGTVRPRWLDDGSSLWYRDGTQALFLDPAEGTPRPATREDRAREVTEVSRSRGGRVYAPAGDRFVGHDEGNLVLGHEQGGDHLPLTDDAEEDVHWMTSSEAFSADGTRLFATRIDAREVHHIPIVDYTAALETVEMRPYVKTGTPGARSTLAIFDTDTGARTDVDAGEAPEGYLFPLGWREGDEELLYLRLNREATRLELLAADPATGKSRPIVTDTQETFVGGLDFITGGFAAYFTPIEGTDTFLWLSDRDGWRHVYRYDYSGALLNRVTAGEFPVLDVLAVDAERGRAFLLANGEDRLYDTHLYRADLTGGERCRLTEATGEHVVELSPSRLYFVDEHSAPGRPPTAELRDVDGRRIAVLSTADPSRLEAIGWTPPEPFVVRAADGETELYGMLYKPQYFDATARYPVIDLIYSGPFMTIVPHDFGHQSVWGTRAHALAQMGFVVFLVDPRGTPERSKAFQDASYGRIGEIEIPDHVATLHQLAAEREWIDLERVGIYGHSWGGYFALRGMLTAPEVFHVGVAGAPGELTENAPINEPYMRLPEHNAAGYAAGLNAPLAANLRGKLLLVHGTADVNAPFSTSMRMAAALIEADQDFEMLVLPGADHYLRGEGGRYANRRIRAFFREHLR